MLKLIKNFGQVAELVDAYGSGPYGETLGGSNPLLPTRSRGGIGIRDSLRSYALWGVRVRVSPRARALSSVGRALRLHRKGRGIITLSAHAEVAKVVTARV